jgi:glycogen operon protein
MHAGHFRFLKRMIAFRKSHPSLGRGRFWRGDVRWHGVGASTDLSHDSHSLAYYLRGATEGDCDLYVMVNAYHEPVTFVIQESALGAWRRAIDTGLERPHDIADPGREAAVGSVQYCLGPRSVAVLVGGPATPG